jgi:23S rRNA pseudouridine1911/1915/1917 synthase
MSDRVATVLQVSNELVDQTVSAALRAWQAGQSWSQIRQLVRSRRVMVSGNLCLDERRRLRSGDVLKILPHPLAAPPKDDDIKIRYIDAHLVVVEKPAGMTSIRHPEERLWPARRRQRQPTLDEILPRIVARREGKGAGKHSPRPLRAVHRLDRETSGLMVFARTAMAERNLGQQFRKHTIHRVYWAIVCGRVDSRTLTSYLVSDRGDGRRGSTVHQSLGKRAVTHVRPLEHFQGYTLVECRLETGRTHQIRIQLAESGHAVCGDRVYHRPRFGHAAPDASGAARQALHAMELGFRHPATGEDLRLSMPLPADLERLVARLRKESRG